MPEHRPVNVCPILNVANGEETHCVKSRCAWWCKSVETSNPVRKCAIVVLAENLSKSKMITDAE